MPKALEPSVTVGLVPRTGDVGRCGTDVSGTVAAVHAVRSWNNFVAAEKFLEVLILTLQDALFRSQITKSVTVKLTKFVFLTVTPDRED